MIDNYNHGWGVLLCECINPNKLVICLVSHIQRMLSISN